MHRPDFLKQGERSRLFPVLSTTSKEGRATSIFLSCLSNIEEFGTALLSSVGQRVGKRSKLECYTEVVFKNNGTNIADRPDGLIIVKQGAKEWRALVEAKVARARLDADQLERYRQLAKSNDIDCVISISNQFTSSPENHPLEEVRKSRSKIPVYHWSWMFLLTNADLLIRNSEIVDQDQAFLLNELRRFLTHDSTGVTGFDKMPSEWTEINKLVSAGGAIPLRSAEARSVVNAWHQETKDLSLILSRQTKTRVSEKLPKKMTDDPNERIKSDLELLSTSNQLVSKLDVPNAAANLDILCDLARRSITVGMQLKAPEDKVSTQARLSWLLRQIKSEDGADVHIRLNWPGRSSATQFELSKLREDPKIADPEKGATAVISFFVCKSKKVGTRFTQQAGFISELEEIVPSFYKEIGQNISSWKKPAPKVRSDVESAEDVSVDAISDEAEQ